MAGIFAGAPQLVRAGEGYGRRVEAAGVDVEIAELDPVGRIARAAAGALASSPRAAALWPLR
jgi:hypothetical protein